MSNAFSECSAEAVGLLEPSGISYANVGSKIRELLYKRDKLLSTCKCLQVSDFSSTSERLIRASKLRGGSASTEGELQELQYVIYNELKGNLITGRIPGMSFPPYFLFENG